MIYKNVIILGGGIVGLTISANLKCSNLVLEKESTCGGHCSTFINDRYTIDSGGPHILFSKNKKVLNYMKNLVKGNIKMKKRNNKIFFEDKFIKYPFENGIYDLTPENRFKCLKDILFNKYKNIKINNLQDWLYATFGKTICDLYLIPYNKKIWKVSPSKLSIDWINGRIPNPPIEDIIKSSVGINTEGYLHQLYYYYPLIGGYQAFTDALESKVKKNIVNNVKILKISKQSDFWIIKTNIETYKCKKLISSIPILDFLKAFEIKNHKVIKLCKKLKYNSLIQVSLAFKNTPKTYKDFTAIYVPDKKYLFHRMSFPKAFSEYNVKGKDFLINLELTFLPKDKKKYSNKTFLINKAVEQCKKIFKINSNKIIFKKIFKTDYAYVVKNFEHKNNIKKIFNFLDRHNLISIGRNSQFEYINSDEAVKRGLETAKIINYDKIK